MHVQQKPVNGVFDGRVKVVSMWPHVGVCEFTRRGSKLTHVQVEWTYGRGVVATGT